MDALLISLDVGTSGARACVFDRTGRLVAEARRGYPTEYPQAGWSQQSAGRWYTASCVALRDVAGQLGKAVAGVAGLALTGQCPTYLPADARLAALGPALTYADNRSTVEAEELTERFGDAHVHSFAGLRPQAHCILPKVLWHKRHEPALYEALQRVLQPTDYVAARLTGELATSAPHACGTLAYDQVRRVWDDEFVAAAGVKPGLFPSRVLDAWQIVGDLQPGLARSLGLPAVPVVIGAPDSQCCQLGVGAIKENLLSNMSGSSTCLNGTQPGLCDDVRVGNYVHAIPGYVSTEVGLNTTGAALNWACDALLSGVAGRRRMAVVEAAARTAPVGSDDVVFMPYLTGGERDGQQVRGGFHGLAMHHTTADLLRAVLEGVAFAERARLEVLTDAGARFDAMHISGGGARLDVWNQIKADVTGLPVLAVTAVDATELGAAMLAGIGVGVYDGVADAVRTCAVPLHEYTPDPGRALQYEARFKAFTALERSLANGSHGD